MSIKKEHNVLERLYEPRRLLEARRQVKSNAEAAGVDQMMVTEFEQRKEELFPVIRTQGHISYFEENKDRMQYDQYIEMKLPIGSGTI